MNVEFTIFKKIKVEMKVSVYLTTLNATIKRILKYSTPINAIVYYKSQTRCSLLEAREYIMKFKKGKNEKV